jgi:hypothetical protein
MRGYYYSLRRTPVRALDDVHNTRYCYTLYDVQRKNIILYYSKFKHRT